MDTDTLAELRTGRLAGLRRLDLAGGLTAFPPEIYDLADSLEILNLSDNRLTQLPDELPRLKKLRILFCAGNDFEQLPAVLGQCPALEMISFKSNRLARVEAAALPPALRWLILTDNRIEQLPAGLGERPRLQKLMLAGNRLTRLPDEMDACTRLELVRLSANRFRRLPQWLYELPRLAWLAFAGNPMTPGPAVLSSPAIDWSELDLHERLGEGASGVIHRARWTRARGDIDLDVAVKVFKGAITSDGLPTDELAACLAAGNHPHRIEILGRVTGHPEQAEALVMPLVDAGYTALAGPPSFDTCTRDVYPPDRRFSLTSLLQTATGIAAAAAHLHAGGILHGDLYAHNILWRADGSCRLGDFGAATCHDGREAAALERLEVRAFGCLLEELLERCTPEPDAGAAAAILWELQARCTQPQVASRPSFAAIEAELQQLALVLGC